MDSRHATHFCEHCGIRLAHWYGESIICARDEYLEKSTRPYYANSPIGPPPAYGARLFAAPQIESPPETPLQRRFEVSRNANNFIKEVRDAAISQPVISVTIPALEYKMYFEGLVFLPYDPSTSASEARYPPAPTANVHLYRGDSAQSMAALLAFHRSKWRVDIGHYPPPSDDGSAQSLPTQLLVEKNPIFLDPVYFQFMSEHGPLAWTARMVNGEMQEFVLLDAYDRMAGMYDEKEETISLYAAKNLSEKFVEEAVATLIAAVMQRTRSQDFLKALANDTS
jgi:hypothetical protein